MSIQKRLRISESIPMVYWLVATFWRFGRSLVREGSNPDSETSWFRDPLSHPDIARMSERERADLPFRPECVVSE